MIIDETYGTLCQTYAATSAHTELTDAVENLRQREAMSGAQDVGYVEIATQERSAAATERHPHAVETIADWAQHAGYDAAIWTALDSHFERHTREPFSVNAAMRFLEDLEQNDPMRSPGRWSTSAAPCRHPNPGARNSHHPVARTPAALDKRFVRLAFYEAGAT